MNKIYRIIWSRVKNAFVVVAEIVRNAGKSTTCDKRVSQAALHTESQAALHTESQAAAPHKYRLNPLLAAAILMALGATPAFADPAANALPTGGQITAGSGSISQSGAHMTVQQNTDKLIANWQSFDIGSQASVTFNQPNTSSVALNRVLGQDPSQIMGQLNANGQVMLVNPSGVVFGAGSQVNVGGITATTLSISDADFLAGHFRFADNSNAAAVENLGHILANGGVVALVAPIVRNQGTIDTPNGSTALVAGNDVTLDFSGDGLVSVTVSQSKLYNLVENKGAIRADEGLVILTAGAASDLLSGVVNNDGIIEARGITQQGGRIVLDGGFVTHAGLLDVSSDVAVGGTVEITGEHIVLAEGSTIDATGASGGGNVLVGGDWQGGANEERRVFDDPNALHQATSVTMEAGATIDASATINGDGGTVVLWSDIHKDGGVTKVEGEILAKGGAEGGAGGQVETSGHKLSIGDNARVNTGGGEWLLDPYDFTIGAGGDITAEVLQTALGSGNVSITTTNTDATCDGASCSAGATGNGDIIFNDAVSWSANTLTLSAYRNIAVNNILSVSGNAALTLTTNTGGATGIDSGYLKMQQGSGNFVGKINWTSTGALTMNGSLYGKITTQAELAAITLTAKYFLANDISFTGNWTRLGNFSGNVDGLGHTISNLTNGSSNTSNDQGLFRL